jgi:hypothetical protein
MSRVRSLAVGGVIGAAVGVVLAPRRGESRRDALQRLRLTVRPGRGAGGAFAGTPCAAEGRSRVRGQAGAPGAAGAAGAATREGDGDG